MPRQSRTSSLAYRTLVTATVLAASLGVASGHQTDTSHWFEHERAMSDGGSTLISQDEARSPRLVNGNGGAAPKTHPNRRVPGSATDCLVEQLQMAEGYVPTGRCTGGFVDESWIVDEDKQRGRGANR